MELGAVMSARAAADIRAALAKAGFGRAEVSVRSSSGSTSSSVRVSIRKARVPLERVEKIADQFEKVDRDQATGEILCGGNTYVFVDYQSGALAAEEAIAQRQLDEGRRDFGRFVVCEADRFTRSVFEMGVSVAGARVGSHVRSIDAQRGGAELAHLLAKKGALVALEDWSVPKQTSPVERGAAE